MESQALMGLDQSCSSNKCLLEWLEGHHISVPLDSNQWVKEVSITAVTIKAFCTRQFLKNRVQLTVLNGTVRGAEGCELHHTEAV